MNQLNCCLSKIFHTCIPGHQVSSPLKHPRIDWVVTYCSGYLGKTAIQSIRCCVVFDLSSNPRVSVSFCQDKVCSDSSCGQILAHQHCISLVLSQPSRSIHLLSCAQIKIVNHERVVDAPDCHMSSSFFLV